MLTRCCLQVRAWDLRDGRQVSEHTGHVDDMCGLAMSPDDRYVFTGSADYTVCM